MAIICILISQETPQEENNYTMKRESILKNKALTFCMAILLLFTGCLPLSENIMVKEKITRDICIAQETDNKINFGLWSLKYKNSVDTASAIKFDEWLLIFRNPTHIAYNSDYILGKTEKNKYVIVKLKEGKLERYYIARGTNKFIAKRKELNIPDSLVLAPIKNR